MTVLSYSIPAFGSGTLRETQVRWRRKLSHCSTQQVTDSITQSFEASAYVPIDDIAYRYMDALMARGELRRVLSWKRQAH